MNGFPDWLLFAKSLNSPGERGKICVVNIKSGQLIGQAVQVDEVTPPSVTVRQVQPSVGGDSGHIALLLNDLRTHAPREIVGEAIALVKEYADVFSRSDIDQLIQMKRDRSSSGCAARRPCFRGKMKCI